MFERFFVFIIKLFAKMKDDNIVSLSAQFSYYIILGIFPFLILAITILCNYRYYIFDMLSLIENILPSDIFSMVSNFVVDSANNCNEMHFSSSVFVILWSSTAGSTTIIRGINRAYGFPVKKNYFFMRLEGIIFALAIMLIMQLIFAVIVLGNEIMKFLEQISILTDFAFSVIHFFRYALPIILLFIIFSAAYKFLTYEKVSFSFVVPGAIVSTLGFVIVSVIYSAYISTKVKYYTAIYGSLSGLIIFLIWIFLLSIVFLTGAEINYFTGRNSQKKKKI